MNKLDQKRAQKAKEYFDHMINESQYCHYFTVYADKRYAGTFGEWHAPFYDYETAFQFKQLIELKRPELDLKMCMGAISKEYVFSNPRNDFEKLWKQQHQNRLAAIQARQVDYCHYFYIDYQKTSKQEPSKHLFGLGGYPFFTSDQAWRFKDKLQRKNPDLSIGVFEGHFDTEYALGLDPVNQYVTDWQERHKARIAKVKSILENLDPSTPFSDEVAIYV